LKWPTERVNAIYKAIIQREAVESIETQRVQMISALFANSNWDGDNAQARADHIKELNGHFNDAIELVYYPQGKEDEINWNNPFWAGAKRGLEKTKLKYGLADGDTVGEVIELTTDSDQEQIKARLESRQAIDQM
jgi:hypothetical protein